MIEMSSCLWVPDKLLSAEQRDSIKKALTVKLRLVTGEKQEVCCLREDRDGYVGLPRRYGLKLISKLGYDVDDMRSRGRKVTFAIKPTLRQEQKEFVAEMIEACKTRTDFVAEAYTGSGKTVCALYVIAKRGRKAAVCVDQENLLQQWVSRCKEHLGLTDDDIGIVRGPKVKYKNKKIVICMIQSLIRKDLPDDFVNSFGTVVFDESHAVGARTYSRSMMLFNAEVRFGVSATPDRRDAFRNLIEWNLGEVAVSLRAEHQESNVYVLESSGVYSWRVNNSKMASGFISEVAGDGKRNLLIAKAIQWLYESGRDILVISDRVEQLCSLSALCEVLGVPKEDLGIYAKMETVWMYEKDPRPARRPYGWVKDTEYTPVHLVLVQKTLRKDKREFVKENSRVIFATYGIMSKGVDIPRLSGGIDATPRREATQTIGRILRTQQGKQRPIWVTVADKNSFRALFQLKQRVADYVNSNAEVYLWDMEKGRKHLNAAELTDDLTQRVSLLRRSRIVTALDGNNTLLTPTTQTDRNR